MGFFDKFKKASVPVPEATWEDTYNGYVLSQTNQTTLLDLIRGRVYYPYKCSIDELQYKDRRFYEFKPKEHPAELKLNENDGAVDHGHNVYVDGKYVGLAYLLTEDKLKLHEGQSPILQVRGGNYRIGDTRYTGSYYAEIIFK